MLLPLLPPARRQFRFQPSTSRSHSLTLTIPSAARMLHSFSAVVKAKSGSFAYRAIVTGVRRERRGSEARRDWSRVWRELRVGEPVGEEMLERVGEVRELRGGR